MQPIYTQHQSTKQQILSFASKHLRTDIIMSAKSLLPNAENERNPLTMSDEQILEQIYSTHVHSDTKFDVDSLFTLVENTLRRSTRIVDNVVQVYMHSFSHFSSFLYVFASHLRTIQFKNPCTSFAYFCRDPMQAWRP